MISAISSEIFGANPQTDKITFQLMPDSESSAQQACIKHFDLLQNPFNPFLERYFVSIYDYVNLILFILK